MTWWVAVLYAIVLWALGVLLGAAALRWEAWMYRRLRARYRGR